MDKQEVARMQVESDRRCSESELCQLLIQTPIIIVRGKGSKIRARVGLGNIVYIQPTKGQIKDVRLGNNVYI